MHALGFLVFVWYASFSLKLKGMANDFQHNLREKKSDFFQTSILRVTVLVRT